MPDSVRTWLCAPGDRPDRCLKALASGADQVIWDLEDAVPDDAKTTARDTLAQLLSGPLPRIPWIRVNGVDTDWGAEDVQRLSRAFPDGEARWVVPKASRQAVERLRQWGIRGRFLLIVETAAGLGDLWDVSRPWRLEGSSRLAFGALDYRNDVALGEMPDETELTMPRSFIALASRCWNWGGPIDAVYPAIDDAEALLASAQRGRALGMAGKMVIHPKQIAPVHAAYAPTAEDVAWAQAVLGAIQGAGAARVEGKMVDRPLVERARQILSEADGIAPEAP